MQLSPHTILGIRILLIGGSVLQMAGILITAWQSHNIRKKFGAESERLRKILDKETHRARDVLTRARAKLANLRRPRRITLPLTTAIAMQVDTTTDLDSVWTYDPNQSEADNFAGLQAWVGILIAQREQEAIKLQTDLEQAQNDLEASTEAWKKALSEFALGGLRLTSWSVVLLIAGTGALLIASLWWLAG